MTERIQSFSSPCSLGLLNNLDALTQGAQFPGSALRMINYEPSLEGGYRRVSGYTNDYGTLPGLDGSPVLGLAVYNELDDGIFGARTPTTGNNYFHYCDNATSAWVTPATSGSPTMTGVTRVRFSKVNWGVPNLLITDGINPAAIWNGIAYSQILHADAPTAPTFSEPFAGHLFLAGDPSEPNNVYFSAPNTATDYAAGNGAGVINVGFAVTAIRAFRDVLYIFGSTNIKRIVGTSAADFQVLDVTNRLGCIAPDSVVEFNSDLLFLSADGIRPISGTDRIGDIEVNVLSKPVQNLFELLYNNEDLSQVTILTLGRKTQFRLFLNNSASFGIIGSLRRSGEAGRGFEYSQLVGMEVACGDSGYVGPEEFVIHGDSTGRVFRQESGDDFAGNPIFSLYQTPYLYMDDPVIRKTYFDVYTYLKSEGTVSVNLGVTYDYGDPITLKPGDDVITTDGAAALWGSATYDAGDIYDGNPSPLTKSLIRGSGRAISLTYVTVDTQPSHTVQAYVISYKLEDRR